MPYVLDQADGGIHKKPAAHELRSLVACDLDCVPIRIVVAGLILFSNRKTY